MDPKSPASKSPHVLTLTPFYPVEEDDAQGCFIAESLTALEAAGVQNTVFVVRPFYRDKVKPNQSAPPARFCRFFAFPGGLGLPSAGNFLSAALLREARNIHRKKPFDLIHAHAALPCGHAAMRLADKLDIPFVVTVHGLDVFFTNQVKGLAGNWCKRISEKVYCSAAKTICISGKVRDCVLHEASADTAVVYNGVDPNRFAPSRRCTEENFVLSVGNLIPIKGHELLLRAFANIHQQFPALKCEIIGDGPERARLESLTRELAVADCVRFRGRRGRAEVASAMARCTLFALPSSYEGLGCVYLEAMASGKPVIACNGQGIEEVINHGKNGLLITPGSLREMTDSLRRTLLSPDSDAQMGKEARQTVLKGFTFSHQADLLLQIYRERIA